MTQQSKLELPYIAVIPFAVLSDKDLQPNAKLFYGCLAGLAKKEGYCWASNENLADMFGVKERIVARWLETLEKKGFIHREVQNTPHLENKAFLWKTERKIFVNDGFSKNSYEHVQKYTPLGDVQKCATLTNKYLSIKKESIRKSEHVELTEQEYDDLVQAYGKLLVDQKILDMEAHCMNKRNGKAYKHSASELRSWCEKDKTSPHATQATYRSPEQKNRDFIKSLVANNPNLVRNNTLYVTDRYIELNDGKNIFNIGYKECVENIIDSWSKATGIRFIMPEIPLQKPQI
jgi:hypothetical protein